MNKKVKYYENLGFIISFIKNEYPAKISKNFSDKVMNIIESNSEKNATFFSLNAIARVASVFVFAIITIYVLQFGENQIEISILVPSSLYGTDTTTDFCRYNGS